MSNTGKTLWQILVEVLTGIRAQVEKSKEQVAPPPSYISGTLTENILLEIIEHEAIVLEAYKDSVGVWTWGVGVTSASGHSVERYIDKPQSVGKVLEIYEWLLRTKYLPDVLEAFDGYALSEAQLGGALSFHWNTGAIKTASWVKSFLRGDTDEAYIQFMNWSTPREIIGRRKCERDLFFKNRWTSDGLVTFYEVSGSHTPKWSSAKQKDIRPQLHAVMEKVEGEYNA